MEICRHKGLRLSEVADRIGSGQSNLVTSVKGSQKTAAKTGILETLEFFSLVYDHNAGRFTLSLCYAKGEIATMVYDKLEYCDWREDDTEETVLWTYHKSPGTSSTTMSLATFRSRALLTLISIIISKSLWGI